MFSGRSEKKLKLARQPEPTTHGTGLELARRWPICHNRSRLMWFPAEKRLISLVRSSKESFVLPPALVRKAAWRE